MTFLAGAAAAVLETMSLLRGDPLPEPELPDPAVDRSERAERAEADLLQRVATLEHDLAVARSRRPVTADYRPHGPCVPINEHLVVLNRVDVAERALAAAEAHTARLVAELKRLGWTTEPDPPGPSPLIRVGRHLDGTAS